VSGGIGRGQVVLGQNWILQEKQKTPGPHGHEGLDERPMWAFVYMRRRSEETFISYRLTDPHAVRQAVIGVTQQPSLAYRHDERAFSQIATDAK
jgi:hypothetical protein